METIRKTLHGLASHPREYDLLVSLQERMGYDTMRDTPPKPWTIWWVLHLFFEAVSVSATGVVFILFFPFYFALNSARTTVHLCLLMAACQIITSWVKDTIRLLRPGVKEKERANAHAASAAAASLQHQKKPSDLETKLAGGHVVRVGGDNYKSEYSFPSGHTSGAVCLAYINGRYAFEHKVATLEVCCVLGALYIVSVGFSRLYLGMHWPGDVMAGLWLGMFLVTSHMFLHVDKMIDWLLASGHNPIAVCCTIAASFLIVRLHPRPGPCACPCLVDSARFSGAALGAVLGVWGWYHHPAALAAAQSLAPATTWGTVAIRTVCAMLQMVAAETLVKSVLVEPILRVAEERVSFAPWFLLSDEASNDAGKKKRTIKGHWTSSYLWSRWISHVVFSFALLFGAPFLFRSSSIFAA